MFRQNSQSSSHTNANVVYLHIYIYIYIYIYVRMCVHAHICIYVHSIPKSSFGVYALRYRELSRVNLRDPRGTWDDDGSLGRRRGPAGLCKVCFWVIFGECIWGS